jgi:DNA-binding transcriptional ArsR family regulator
MVRCRIKQGDQETKFEAEVPISMSVKDAEVEFDRAMRLELEGEGKVTLDLPATVCASRLLLEGSASIRTEEGVPFMPRAPRGKIQRRILEKLEEADYTAKELAECLGMDIRQVDNAALRLRRKGLVSVVRGKLHKVGVSRRDPTEVRSPGGFAAR